ncbi:putative mediator complex subunit 15, KIX domain-containing protein [Helianthus debilis subsp. tardiflorus]
MVCDLENVVILNAKYLHHFELHVLILCRVDTLKRNLPFTRHEDLQELKNIAKWIEEESYVAATSQVCCSEYSRKICLMTLNMETRLQSDYAPLYKRVNPSLPLDSTASGGDWQEEAYQKVLYMRSHYCFELNKIITIIPNLFVK